MAAGFSNEHTFPRTDGPKAALLKRRSRLNRIEGSSWAGRTLHAFESEGNNSSKTTQAQPKAKIHTATDRRAHRISTVFIDASGRETTPFEPSLDSYAGEASHHGSRAIRWIPPYTVLSCLIFIRAFP